MVIGGIIAVIVWLCVCLTWTLMLVTPSKLKKEFDKLEIGSIYAVVKVEKVDGSPFERKEVEEYIQLINKQKINHQYFLTYRHYDPSKNTCMINEWSMKFDNPNSLIYATKKPQDMTIWHRYDIFVGDMIKWLNEIKESAKKNDNKEVINLVDGCKKDIKDVYDKVLI
jgi:hypothetical protein